MHVNIKCPYFYFKKDLEFKCEAATIHLPDSVTMRDMVKTCAGDWLACPLASALDDYYRRFYKEEVR